MRNILILDTETTGLDANTCSIIEIAAIYYNIPTRSIIQQCSTLIRQDKNEAHHINKISAESLNESLCDLTLISINLIREMIRNCDAIVAHNTSFDRSFIRMFAPLVVPVCDKTWICTKNDFEWPIRKGSSLSLVNIAVEMGVPVVSAHRALTDCTLLASCFDKIPDLQERFNETVLEKEIYEALVSYDDRKLAVDEGFLWEPKSKKWIKKISSQKAALISNFKVRKIQSVF